MTENEVCLHNQSDWENAMLVKQQLEVPTELPTTLKLSIPMDPSWEMMELT